MDFDKCLERISLKTEITNQTKLAELLNISTQAVSNQRNKKEFPIKWAYTVAQKYRISTDWIMTGKENRRMEKTSAKEIPIIEELNEWLSEIIKKNEKREIWFELIIEDTFKDFIKWKQQREEKRNEDNQDGNMAV